MLIPSLCDQADAYIHVKGTIKITRDARPPSGRTEAQLLAVRQAEERNKVVIFKNCASFTKCIRKINDTEYIIIVIISIQ